MRRLFPILIQLFRFGLLVGAGLCVLYAKNRCYVFETVQCQGESLLLVIAYLLISFGNEPQSPADDAEPPATTPVPICDDERLHPRVRFPVSYTHPRAASVKGTALVVLGVLLGLLVAFWAIGRVSFLDSIILRRFSNHLFYEVPNSWPKRVRAEETPPTPEVPADPDVALAFHGGSCGDTCNAWKAQVPNGGLPRFRLLDPAVIENRGSLVDGQGLAVACCVETIARYQGFQDLEGFAAWAAGLAGGSWPAKLDRQLKDYAALQGRRPARLANYEGTDDRFIERAVNAGHPVAVSDHGGALSAYGRKACTMVVVVDMTPEWVCVFDPNYPRDGQKVRYEWLRRSEFRLRWIETAAYLAWAFFLEPVNPLVPGDQRRTGAVGDPPPQAPK